MGQQWLGNGHIHSRFLVAPIVVAFAIGLYASPRASVSDGIGLDPGVYEWNELGFTRSQTIDLPVAVGSNPTVQWSFEVEDGASQGPELWWYLHLEGVVSIDRSRAAGGIAYVWVSVNERPVAGIKYAIDKDSPVEVSSANYVGGSLEHSTSDSIPIHFTNVLPPGAVTPGRADVEVRLEAIDDPGQITLEVSKHSKFEVATRNPFPLSLEQGTGSMDDGALRLPLRLSSSDGAITREVTAHVLPMGLLHVSVTGGVC